MSTSIYGFVEIYFDAVDTWIDTIDAGVVLGNDYDVMGCLFGVRNYGNFAPLFPDRGLAPNSSGKVYDDYRRLRDEITSISWCNYEELSCIDLSELSLEPDQRIWVNNTKRFPETDKEKLLRKYITRKEALSNAEFQLLLTLMKALADRYGAKNVRLSVYFD